jgi:hypothetical protein
MKETNRFSEEKADPELVEDHEISFADTQSFHFWSTERRSSKDEEPPSEPEEEEIMKRHLRKKLCRKWQKSRQRLNLKCQPVGDRCM